MYDVIFVVFLLCLDAVDCTTEEHLASKNLLQQFSKLLP